MGLIQRLSLEQPNLGINIHCFEFYERKKGYKQNLDCFPNIREPKALPAKQTCDKPHSVWTIQLLILTMCSHFQLRVVVLT